MGNELSNKMLKEDKVMNVFEAYNARLVHSVHQPSRVLTAAQDYCRELCNLPHNSFESIRPIIRENLVEILREVNRRECAACEKSWVSSESFDAISKYLLSRGMYAPAICLLIANRTRKYWDIET